MIPKRGVANRLLMEAFGCVRGRLPPLPVVLRVAIVTTGRWLWSGARRDCRPGGRRSKPKAAPVVTVPLAPVWVQVHQIWCKRPNLIAALRTVVAGISEGESARREKQER